MDSATSQLWLVAKAALLIAGLLVPGGALMRALRVPATVATSFAGSALALYATVLALQFTSIRISLVSLAAGLALITVAAHQVRNRSKPTEDEQFSLREWIAGMGAWTPLYALFWIAALWRAVHEPLAGPDIEFRWSFLAEQMLATGTLDYYPPRTAADFFRYFWVESIPPGASALHTWAYACAGGAKAAWTIPAVVLQLWSLHALVWRAAYLHSGERAARFACLAAAACPLLTWSVRLGQETGLTALSLAGLVFALLGWRRNGTPGWAALSGLFAALGASAREYGLVFPLLAAAGLLVVQANRRAWLAFVVPALLAVIWPLRTWALTGNPFYSLDVAGLFPTNPRFLEWIGLDAESLGAALTTTAGWREIGRFALQYAPVALFGWLWLALAALRGSRISIWGLGAVVIVLGLWATSVRYTNGGLFYSLRVTSPALALGAISAGIALASTTWSRRSLAIMAPALLSLLVLATLPPTLALPKNQARTPWREWPAFAPRADPLNTAADPTAAIFQRVLRARPGEHVGIVLADSPGFQHRLAPLGLKVLPLWSPQADWLFDASLPPAELVRRWRESGITHVIHTKWQTNLDFFTTHSRLARPPLGQRMLGETALTAVFAITLAE